MKILYKEISTCRECPYLEYDPYYSMIITDGWDCNNTGERLINGEEWNEDFKIPKSCPLPGKLDVLKKL